MTSLAQQWAKRYVQNLQGGSVGAGEPAVGKLTAVGRKQSRVETAEQLRQSLRLACAGGWSKTEMLLAREVKRQGLDLDLINPWQIAADAHQIYERALEFYADREAPQQFSLAISREIGRLRQTHTAADPRVLGFVNLQFHHTGQLLLEQLPDSERPQLGYYFKVIEDNLNMPLQRSYEAAVARDSESPELLAVQQLLPVSSEIAEKVCWRVAQLHPNYRTLSGLLSQPRANLSSAIDVEMFQVYLWVCLLEGSIAAVQQELFPLCVFLYPVLGIKWELVRQMLSLLQEEMQRCLPADSHALFAPYFQALSEMFSPEVFAKGDGREELSIENLGNYMAG
ncbi:MAG: hypothetical protein KME26_13490 [Oscillatoria princeps RMCB-10]|nr:hypothetical protein [Oscillatoria princeps RMCB-10]